MYRVTSHILTSRSILYCRPAVEIQIKTIGQSIPLKYKNPLERETCPPPPPTPPPPPKDDKLLWGALTVLVLAGGFGYYAKQTPEVRDWLSLHAPWFDDIIAIVSQENLTYAEFYEQCKDDLKKYIKDHYDENKPKPCSLDAKPIEVPEEPPKDSAKELCKVESNEDDDENKPCELIPPPVISKNICDIERCIIELGEAVVNNYITAKDVCAYYNKLVEETMVNFSMTLLSELHVARAERNELLQQSKDNICVASKKLDELSRYLECGMQAPKEKIDTVRGHVANFQDKISASRIHYEWEYDKTVELDAHVDQVEQLMLKYTDENQTLFSGLKYDQKKPMLTGDPDLLLYHTYRYVNRLQAQVVEASAGMTERVDRALETLPQDPQALKARNYMIQSTYKKKKYEMDREFSKRYEDQRVNNDNTLKEALAKQLERHEDNMKFKLLQKENQTQAKLDKLVAEKVAAEKRIFAAQLADMADKLKNVEAKLHARLKAEREARRSQELWAAGASLLAATKKGDQIVRVDKELRAIEKASGDEDKLVKAVLKSIPESVRTTGLVPESVLRERYHRMEKAALRVALVEEDGGPLPIFFLSWLQSMMLFMKLSCIPQAEYNKPPPDPIKDLDTFDLLRRARFWIEHGNLAVAVRYVSSLQGASRLAASTWFEAARSHLETRQAAEAVLAHAAALGLQYI